VDNRADVLRASVASARNDHRLGANEAPPAIMSIFLGDELTDIIEQIEKGESRGRKDGAVLHVGVSSLPRLAKDMTDRNRTSPFAFTGNKFEFRAVGSNQSCSFPMTVLNTIVAEALDRICTAFEQALARKKDFNSALEALMRDIIRKHKRILFNGDNYTAEWQAEAKRRGLANIKDTPSALKALEKSDVFAMFEKYNVLSRRELESRHEVFAHEYAKTVAIEAQCAATIARTMIVPAAIEYQETIGSSLAAMKAGGMKAAMKSTKALLARIAGEAEMLLAETANLEKAVAADAAPAMLAGMQAVRKHADELEGLVPQDLWPLPSYAEMLFMM
jgi:glutamine synthetase